MLGGPTPSRPRTQRAPIPMRTHDAMRPQLHSATWLALWLLWLIAGQTDASPKQEIWVVVSLLAAVLGAFGHVLRLLRRLRWLFLVMAITFLFGTPGRLLVDDLSGGPTVEGLHAALRTGLHLAAMAGCVAVLLRAMPLPALAGAMHRILHPISAGRPGPDSFALRLQLVLRDLEHIPARGRWREWLAPVAESAPLAVEPCPPFARADVLAITLGLCACVLWIYRG